MNITEKFKKPYWVRKVADGVKPRIRTFGGKDTGYYFYPDGSPRPDEIYLTEEDFIREIRQSAHTQMSEVQSSCPVWAQTTDPNDPTKKKWMIDHFDDIEVTTSGVQKQGANKFISHMSAKGFGLACELKGGRDEFDILNSWKDIVGINTTAFVEICTSLAYTCEALVYQYAINNQEIEYTVFSYLKGDRIFVDTDKNRNPVYYRKYTLKGKSAVDIFSTKRVQTWVAYDETDDNGWWGGVKSWFNRLQGSMVGVTSDDGYICVADNETQTSDNVNPCSYFRFNDLRSGDEQLNIESYERAASMVAEEYKEDAFPDFFIKAEKIVSLPPKGKFGRRTYGVKGSADSIAHADARFIAPANASNIAQLNLDLKWNDIRNSMQMVYIDPEILKSGADSSTTIKILFTPEIQYCQLMWTYLFKPLKHMMNVFKELVGLVEGKSEAFSRLRISIYPDFWIPNNISEETENTCKLVYAGILSQEDGRNELGVQYVNSAKTIANEKEQQLYRETYVPLKAKYDAGQDFGTEDVAEDIVVEDAPTASEENPYKPTTKVDNNMDRRDIVDQ